MSIDSLLMCGFGDIIHPHSDSTITLLGSPWKHKAFCFHLATIQENSGQAWVFACWADPSVWQLYGQLWPD